MSPGDDEDEVEVEELPVDEDDLDDLVWEAGHEGPSWFRGGANPKVAGRPVEDAPPL